MLSLQETIFIKLILLQKEVAKGVMPWSSWRLEKIMRVRITYIVSALLFLIFCACAEVLPKIQNPFENKDGNFTLYVSNQSFEIKTVDILIVIDGTPIVHEYFKVGNQHLWKQFVLQLPDGIHKIQAVTRKGNATIEQSFEVKGNHWAVLDFCYGKSDGHKCNKPALTFEISDKPIYFL